MQNRSGGGTLSKLRRAVGTSASRWQIQPRFHLASMSTKPLSRQYGFDRGKPADRRYYEEFLAGHASLIRGRCIEVKDDSYVRQYGGSHVDEVDVLDINPSNHYATIIGDLSHLDMIPESSYDCAVITATLQYLPDPRIGVREIHRILAPGGTALVTVPCIQREEGGDDGADHWRFLPKGIAAIFGDLEWDHLEIACYGNALVGIAIWSGMAIEDLPARVWDFHDPPWTCVIGVRATKPIDIP